MVKKENKDLIKGTTSTGFEYEIEKSRLSNYELLEQIAEVDENPLALPKVLKLLLGSNVDKLKDHIRDENGFVDVEKLMAETQEILQGPAEIKK